MHNIATKILEGDKRAVARVMTWIENRKPEGRQVLTDLFSSTGSAYVIGITGSPGSGKSSLTDSFVTLLRQAGKSVGIIAVDPTSPFTGGAILGDRVRMNHHATDPEVFIRSMGTRGALGGVARSTREFVQVLDAYGCDYIFVETVGVGQSEIDILHIADTTVVVLTPGAGDQVQSIKAGVMEIADVYLVNKADLPGADKTVEEVETLLDLIHDFEFRPKVYKTLSQKLETVSVAWEGIIEHRDFLNEGERLKKKQAERIYNEILSLCVHDTKEAISRMLYVQSRDEIQEGDSPYEQSQKLLKLWAEEILSGIPWKTPL